MTASSSGAFSVSRFAGLLPPPAFLAMPGTGLDISGGSVKLVELERRPGGLSLLQYASVEVPEGTIVEGDIAEPKNLIDVLRRLRAKHRIRFVHASLPERKAFLYRARVPKSEDQRNLAQTIESELEEHVPIPPAEAYFDFEVVPSGETADYFDVGVTVFARRVVDEYAAALRDAGLVPLSFEVESHALARSVVPLGDLMTAMIVDFGRHTTRISLVSRGAVAFTATVDIGGNTLTQAVMKHLNVDEAQAEQIKNEKGFIANTANKDLYESMMLTVSVLKDELRKHFAYWEEHREQGESEPPIERIILSGGNANLRGLPEYLSSELACDVVVANVWTNAFSFARTIPPILKQRSLEYATSVGLALRSFIPS